MSVASEGVETTNWKDILSSALVAGVEYVTADQLRDHDLELAKIQSFNSTTQQRTDEVSGQQIPSGSAAQYGIPAGFSTGSNVLNVGILFVVGFIMLKAAKVV